MLNRLFLAGAAMLLAAPAFAQTPPIVTTTYATAPTITAGNCTITGATTFQYNPNTNTLVLQNASGSCGGTPPPPTASVTVSINSGTYTLGSTAGNPVISVTNNTPAATVVCTLAGSNGFTVTGSPVTNSGTFTLSTPTAAGTYSFTPVCTTSTSGYNPTVTSGTVSLNVVSGGGGGNNPPCSATQLSTPVNGVTFQRQCSGTVYILPSTNVYNGPLTDLGTVLGGKQYPQYSYAGFSPTFQIQSGYYVALAFTPTASGAIQLVANNSYGDGGSIIMSTIPGALTRGATGVVCALTFSASNSMYISPTASICPVTPGQTYYINLLDTDTSGAFLCYGGSAGSCATSSVSYTLYTSSR